MNVSPYSTFQTINEPQAIPYNAFNSVNNPHVLYSGDDPTHITNFKTTVRFLPSNEGYDVMDNPNLTHPYLQAKYTVDIDPVTNQIRGTTIFAPIHGGDDYFKYNTPWNSSMYPNGVAPEKTPGPWDYSNFINSPQNLPKGTILRISQGKAQKVYKLVEIRVLKDAATVDEAALKQEMSQLRATNSAYTNVLITYSCMHEASDPGRVVEIYQEVTSSDTISIPTTNSLPKAA